MGHLKPVQQAFTAGADLSALEHTQVKYGADKSTVVGCGNDERAIGVLENAPASGEDAIVTVAGGTKVKVGSAGATLGASVGVGALGVAKDAGAAKYSLGVYQDTGVENDLVPIIIDRHTTPA